MPEIAENLRKIKSQLPTHVTLVAVSKTRPAADVWEAFNCGQLDFGENRVQELVSKKDALPDGIHWHQIGTLQKNKVKYIASFVHLIHAVDNEELLKTIQKEAQKAGRIINCLLQVHIAEEESKFGFEPASVSGFLGRFEQAAFPNVMLRGLMGMATNTEDESIIRQEFRGLKSLFDELRNAYAVKLPQFDILSMGMSSDYQIAIEEGSTMIRIGSAIFGSRN